ncbi:MAG: hypothetical protein EOO56_08405 [Hymenobacter sp.]|nr:MAG: hypothetical protein EOO56_08405 [Hymenobacter sp.]
MKNLPLWVTLFLLGAACSSDPKQTEAVQAPDTATAPAATAPAKGIDERNGFRSHHFGDDITTFPGLVPVVSYGSPDIKQYKLPASKENLQIGDVKLRAVTYSFYKDKFYSVSVQADKPDNAAFDGLTAAATSLYGKGKEFGSGTGTGWYGEKVNGSVSIENSLGSRGLQMKLTSKTIDKQIEADKLSVGKRAASDL